MAARPAAFRQVLFHSLVQCCIAEDFQTLLETLLAAAAVPVCVHKIIGPGPNQRPNRRTINTLSLCVKPLSQLTFLNAVTNSGSFNLVFTFVAGRSVGTLRK